MTGKFRLPIGRLTNRQFEFSSQSHMAMLKSRKENAPFKVDINPRLLNALLNVNPRLLNVNRKNTNQPSYQS